MATKRILHTLKLDRIAAVDRPCQEHATVAIMKRRSDDPKLDIHKATFSEALAGQLIADKVRDVFWRAFDNQYQANEAFKRALIDDLVSGGDGTAPSNDYVAAIAVMAASAVTAAREIGAKATDEELGAAVEKAIAEYVSTKQETTDMTITTKAALQAAVAKFDPAKTTVAEVAEIQKAAKTLDLVSELPVSLAPVADGSAEIAKFRAEMAKEKTINAMSPDVRKHFDGLDEAAQTAFLAKSEADRTAIVADINKGDPVVYTTADGDVIRKSDGGAVLAMAKRIDAQNVTIKALSASSAEGDLAKACAKYPHVAKAIVATTLKARDSADDETEKAAFDAQLKAMNDANRGVFKNVGSSASLDPVADDDRTAAATKMATIVKRVQDANLGMTIYQATAKAAQEDAEYRELYNSSESLIIDDSE